MTTSGDVPVDLPVRAGQHLRGEFTATELLCSDAVRTLRVDGAGIVLHGGRDSRELVVATDVAIARLDLWQFTLRQGPGPDSYLQRRAVLVPDLRAAPVVDRWPDFAPAAAALGAGSMFAYPLLAAGAPIGVVQFWAAGRELNPRPEAAAALLQSLTAAVLADFAVIAAAHPAWVRPAASPAYAPVALATGMISAQLGTSISDALARLRARAVRDDRVLTEVADDVVARRLTFADQAR